MEGCTGSEYLLLQPGLRARDVLCSVLEDALFCWKSAVNIRKLISECFFFKCDFSKEQCSSLKMILGSKHVGAILSILM